jgi:hypothetical protein
MKEFYCRGHEKRVLLVKKYEIIPVTHLPLLNGQIRYSAAEGTLTKECYYFSYRKRDSDEEYKTFICGIFVADDFLKLLKMKPLPIFSILKNEIRVSNNQKNKTNKKDTRQVEKWDPLALEVYRIINIILMTWNTNGGILSEILIKIRNDFKKTPDLKYIKSVNTIISKDSEKRSIYQMLENMKTVNNIKDYKFPLVEKVLLDNNIINNITASNCA